MSDLFKDFMGNVVDLDDDGVYSNNELSPMELWDRCVFKIGYVFLYVNYFHVGGDFGEQWGCVEGLIKEFSDGQRAHRFVDSRENRRWFQKWLYRFEDEIENMC